MSSVLLTLATGAGLLAIGELVSAGSETWTVAGGWVRISSAVLAFSTATALMVHGAAGKVVRPLFERGNRASSRPGETVSEPIAYAKGMPGLEQGQ